MDREDAWRAGGGGGGSGGGGGRVLRSMYSDWPAIQSIKPSGSSGEQR